MEGRNLLTEEKKENQLTKTDAKMRENLKKQTNKQKVQP